MPKNARQKRTLKSFQMDPDVDGTGGDGSCVNKGTWTAEEDRKLAECIEVHGPRRWNSLAMKSGLKRCGKSCRLRWLNYLRPDIKRGDISPAEDDLILRLHRLLGNRWSLIAGRLPGRTDNEIKNYWNAHLRKKAKLMDKLPATSTALHVHTEFHHHNHRHEKIAVESSSSTSRVELDNNIAKLTSSGEAEQDEDYDLSSSGNGGDDQHLFDFSARGTCGLEWVKTFLELEEHHGPS